MAKNLKKAKSFRFSDDELKLLDALKAKYGSYNKGIIAAAKLDLSNEALTKDEVVTWLWEKLPDESS